MLEAIVALPEKMFYNTPINTYLWIVTNNKAKERKGKIQLIDATNLKSPLRKILVIRTVSSLQRSEKIVELYLAFNDADETYSKVFVMRNLHIIPWIFYVRFVCVLISQKTDSSCC